MSDKLTAGGGVMDWPYGWTKTDNQGQEMGGRHRDVRSDTDFLGDLSIHGCFDFDVSRRLLAIAKRLDAPPPEPDANEERLVTLMRAFVAGWKAGRRIMRGEKVADWTCSGAFSEWVGEHSPTEPRTCHWTNSGVYVEGWRTEYWHTECGVFGDYHDTMTYCPYCGKRLDVSE